MSVGAKTIAAVLVLAVLGFAGGYAVASAGETPTPKPGKVTRGELPAVPAAGSAPRIAVLGTAAALPRKRAKVTKKKASPAPSSGGTTPPSSEATPPPASTPAPSQPPSNPPSNPPQSTPAPDIIEG
jgi:hypothetical protein